MTKKDASVSDGETGGVANATPASGDGVTNVTPTQPSGDWEAKFAKLQSELEKSQKDLNALKSASQKRESEAQRRLQEQRDTYEQRLTALMDDDTRAEYEASTREARLRELQEQAQNAQMSAQRLQATNDAFNAFIQRGVPSEILMDYYVDGPEAMAGAAWDWLYSKANTTPQQVVQQTSSSETPTDDEPKAPKVVTTTTDTPYEGPSWKELVEKYGSEDQVFTYVELGLLPPDVVPEFRTAKQKEE